MRNDFLDNLSMGNPWWPNIMPTEAMKNPHPRVLLVDDDPVYCKTMARIAKRNSIDMTTCSTIQELENSTRDSAFDVALVDFYLGERTAPDVIPLFSHDTPVILISGSSSEHIVNSPWPSNIHRFIPKNRGTQAILNEAIAAVPQRIAAAELTETVPPTELRAFLEGTVLIALTVLMLSSLAWLSMSMPRLIPLQTSPHTETILPESFQQELPFNTPQMQRVFHHYRWDAAPQIKGRFTV